MLEERRESILEAAVKEFIRTGDPISSGLLYDKYDFGIKPAMIRSELQELTDMGFLEQPYHSSGRIPSDRGLRLFVEHVLQDEVGTVLDRTFHKFFQRAQWDDFLTSFSEEFGVLGAIEDFGRGELLKEGLHNLIEELDWNNPEDIKKVVRDFEELDERLNSAQDIFNNGERISVFIGKQSPITKCEQLSVIAGNYEEGGRRVTIFAIGPKHMNYEKVIGTLKNLVTSD